MRFCIKNKNKTKTGWSKKFFALRATTCFFVGKISAKQKFPFRKICMNFALNIPISEFSRKNWINIPISEFSLDFLLKMPISEYLLKNKAASVCFRYSPRWICSRCPNPWGRRGWVWGFCRGIGNYPDRKSSRIVTNFLIRTQFFITKTWQSHNCDRHVIFVL